MKRLYRQTQTGSVIIITGIGLENSVSVGQACTRLPGYFRDPAVADIVLEAKRDEFIRTCQRQADDKGQALAAPVGILITLHIEGTARRIARQQPRGL